MRKPADPILEQKVARALDGAARSAAKWSAKIESLRVQLAEVGCRHSKTAEYRWTHYDGYGSVSPCVGRRCELCMAIQHYPPTGTWADPKDLNRDRED